MQIEANNPQLHSWVNIPKNSDFPIQNLPFGIFSQNDKALRAGVALGEYIIDLTALVELGFFDEINLKDPSVFYEACLNDFIALGKPTWRAVRQRISELFREKNPELRDNQKAKEQVLIPMKNARMHMPVKVGDYTDFYSSIEHARNVGTMFRDPENALFPNWKHLPVGYHGRASSIVISGTDIHRPKGQTMPPTAEKPIFIPSKRVDFELEIAFITGGPTAQGKSLSIEETEDYIFGFVLFNDWSARDIQKWEYVPLGPFLAKSFASSISPWIVTKDALEPFSVATPKQVPEVLPYLKFEGNKNFDINLEVSLQPENAEENIISKSNFKYMYWNCNQQLAHQTVNGCNINAGDMYASGTISGKDKDSFGSLLELTWGGKKPLKLKNGLERKFIEDNDTIIMRGFAQKDGIRVGFGEVRGKILPALP